MMRSAHVAFLSLFVLAASALGCANQGEGELCNRSNGDDDCESGLVCTSKEKLKSNADLCCPPPPKVPSVPQCSPGAGGASGPDAGAGGSGGSDAGQPDASELPDAEADATSDAEAPEADASDDASDAAND